MISVGELNESTDRDEMTDKIDALRKYARTLRSREPVAQQFDSTGRLRAARRCGGRDGKSKRSRKQSEQRFGNMVNALSLEAPERSAAERARGLQQLYDRLKQRRNWLIEKVFAEWCVVTNYIWDDASDRLVDKRNPEAEVVTIFQDGGIPLLVTVQRIKAYDASESNSSSAEEDEEVVGGVQASSCPSVQESAGAASSDSAVADSVAASGAASASATWCIIQEDEEVVGGVQASRSPSVQESSGAASSDSAVADSVAASGAASASATWCIIQEDEEVVGGVQASRSPSVQESSGAVSSDSAAADSVAAFGAASASATWCII